MLSPPGNPHPIAREISTPPLLNGFSGSGNGIIGILHPLKKCSMHCSNFHISSPPVLLTTYCCPYSVPEWVLVSSFLLWHPNNFSSIITAMTTATSAKPHFKKADPARLRESNLPDKKTQPGIQPGRRIVVD